MQSSNNGSIYIYIVGQHEKLPVCHTENGIMPGGIKNKDSFKCRPL